MKILICPGDEKGDGSSLDFLLDFSTNLRTRHDTNQKADAIALERELKENRFPKTIKMDLGNENSFNREYNNIKHLKEAHNLQSPVKCFVNIKIINSYRLKHQLEGDEKYHEITFVPE